MLITCDEFNFKTADEEIRIRVIYDALLTIVLLYGGGFLTKNKFV